MIGADEFTACDRSGNTAFVGSQKGRDDYLERCKTLGFEVRGTTVVATKLELEQAWARAAHGGAR